MLKITVKGQKKVIKFMEVKIGDVFIWGDDVFMKIGSGIEQNAVDLKIGDKFWNFQNEEVTPVEAELIVH